MVIDTRVCSSSPLSVDLQVAIKGRKSHNNMRHQIYASACGCDPFTPPDLNNIECHGDCQYFLKNAIFNIVLKIGRVLTCACPKGIWLLFVLCDATLLEGVIKARMLGENMMTCKFHERRFKADIHVIRLAITAYCNGNGTVILVASLIR
jgi:hypothetical protein